MSVPLTRTSGPVKISSCASSGKSAAMNAHPAWISAMNPVDPLAAETSLSTSTWVRTEVW